MAKTDGKVGSLPVMPSPHSGKIAILPGKFGTSVTVPTGGYGILVLAPFAQTLGAYQVSTAVTAAGGTSSAANFFNPPFISSMVKAADDSVAVPAPMLIRHGGLCMRITNMTALGSLGGSLTARRVVGPLDLTVGGSTIDPGFSRVWNSILADGDVMPAAQFAKPVCVQCVTNDRDATNFEPVENTYLTATTAVASSNTKWGNIYTFNTAAIGTYQMDWSPVVIALDNSTNLTVMSLTIEIEYSMQVLPTSSSYLSSIGHYLPVGGQERYLSAERMLVRRPIWMASSMPGHPGRDLSGYLGINQVSHVLSLANGKRAAKPKGNLRGSRGKNGNRAVPPASANRRAADAVTGATLGAAYGARGSGQQVRAAVGQTVRAMTRRFRRAEL